MSWASSTFAATQHDFRRMLWDAISAVTPSFWIKHPSKYSDVVFHPLHSLKKLEKLRMNQYIEQGSLWEVGMRVFKWTLLSSAWIYSLCNANHRHSHSWDCWRHMYLGWPCWQATPETISNIMAVGSHPLTSIKHYIKKNKYTVANGVPKNCSKLVSIQVPWICHPKEFYWFLLFVVFGMIKMDYII